MTALPIPTIGYGAARFAQARDALVAAGAGLLIDVRAAASRRHGFSQAPAGRRAGGGRHRLPAPQPLGTPRNGREAVRRGDVGTMARIFRAHMQGDRPQAALAALAEADALATGKRVCLLYFEHDHADCHRALVADMIATGAGQAVEHLRAAINRPEPAWPRRRQTRS